MQTIKTFFLVKGTIKAKQNEQLIIQLASVTSSLTGEKIKLGIKDVFNIKNIDILEGCSLAVRNVTKNKVRLLPKWMIFDIDINQLNMVQEYPVLATSDELLIHLVSKSNFDVDYKFKVSGVLIQV